MEQTLMPLTSQITTLINHKNTRVKRSATSRKVMQEICTKLKEAIFYFVKIGEDISANNPEFATDMGAACSEAKAAATMIGSLADLSAKREEDIASDDRVDIIRAARAVLAAVTRVLIITDMVVVKRLLNAARKVDERLQALESVNNFTEFVQAFSHFGADMVELAHLSGDRQNDLKDDSSKAEMCAARTLLEKSTMLLLTTSKTFLRHPDSTSAKQNREGVFVKMRSAMETITSVAQTSNRKRDPRRGQLILDLKSFDHIMEKAKNKNFRDNPDMSKKLGEGLRKILDDARTVAEAPHTKSERRDRILALCDNTEDVLQEISVKDEDGDIDKQDLTLQRIAKLTKDVKKEVQQAASDQVFETFSHLGHKKSLPAMRAAASTGNIARVNELAEIFVMDVKKLQEVSKVARNLSASEPIAITAEKVEENIQTLCPHVIEAARTLAMHPVSKIAQENTTVFVDIWESQVEELGKLLRSIITGGDLRRMENKPARTDSFPSRIDRMLKRGLKCESPITSDSEDELEKRAQNSKEQEKLNQVVLDIDSLTVSANLNGRDIDPLHEELMRKAREMSVVAETMSRFLRGEGRIHSSEELFFEAQRFAEIGRKFHKLTTQFMVQLPDTLPKKQLIPYTDRIPGYCQQLNFASKSFAVGQSATYIKAGSAIHLTRNILKIVAKIIATFHNLTLGDRGSEQASVRLHSLSWTSEDQFSDDSTISSLSSTPVTSPHTKEPPPFPLIFTSDLESDLDSNT